MSKFRGWPEQQTYEGAEETQLFLDAWRGAWEDWEMAAESYHEAGDKVVAIMRQRGRARSTGIDIEMSFAMVWTLRDGLATRMEMYAEPEEALAAAGLPSASEAPDA
jgi:ketosteroid isomerase-like protein